jgi:hypothetical protein
MKRLFVAAGLAGILALTACSGAPGVTGTVTEKEVETSYRKKKLKTCYELEITDAQGTEHDFCVTKRLYDKYSVGDKYPKG